MKFKFIRPDCKKVNAYSLRNISTGDTVELDGYFAEKATNNPDFELIKKVKKNGNSGRNKRQSGA